MNIPRNKRLDNFTDPIFFSGYKKGYTAGVEKGIEVMKKAIDKSIRTTNGVGEKKAKAFMTRIESYMRNIRDEEESKK